MLSMQTSRAVTGPGDVGAGPGTGPANEVDNPGRSAGKLTHRREGG